jgi:raffinose/stachyose/melibiose transport system permease protein
MSGSMNRDTQIRTVLLTLLATFGAVLFLGPFYFVVINSVKDYGDILRNAAALPTSIELENYVIGYQISNFLRAFLNSLYITSISLVFMVFVGATAAWRMVRRPHKFSKILFGLFVVAMVIPFQSVMIPLMRIVQVFNLLNSRNGLIVIYLGLGMPFTVFLLHGFARSVPLELEESAYLDGASTVRIFVSIVLPLLKSMLATVTILQAFWIWNDFLLPLLILFDNRLQTIPIAIFGFFGQYTDQWDYALATLVMGIAPIVTFFIFMQRFIIRGVIAGSLKG